MSYLFRHSTVGSLARYLTKGNFSFTRDRASHSTASSTDDVTIALDVDLTQTKTNLVTWDGPDDPSNPQNWPIRDKVLMTFIISFYTFAVYVGSSIYSPAQAHVQNVFGVGHVEGSLGLALYVLGYGIGCLLFSPISEIPAVGRNPPYAISGFLFVILCIPTALVDNYPGMMVLRFLLGFMASPCLATAGASLADIWTMAQFPFAVALWAATATMGPAFGPTLSAYAVESLGWRFAAWELMLIAGPVYLLMLCTMPESSGPTILYYKAKRLREETGNTALLSDAERKQMNLQASSLLFDALVKPWEINALDPAILFTTVYMGLCYGTYYSFFESLPLVYPSMYHFSAESTSLVFLVVAPAGLIAFAAHCVYLKIYVFPRLTNGTFGELENHLLPGLAASPVIVIGLFMFAWASRPTVHWIVPTIGLGLSVFGIYFVAQSVLLYIPNIYPRYAASIFSANSLSRSAFAFAAVLFSRPMFEALGVDGGVSLLGGCMVLCTLGMAGLFWYGKRLRERSRFAVA